MDPVPGREGELGALAIILVSVCAYLLLELEWRQLLTRPVSRSCHDKFQGGVFLLVHVCRHLQCMCTMLLCHILSVAAVWTGVCGVGRFCVIPVCLTKRVHVPFSVGLALGSGMYVSIWLDTVCVLRVRVRVTA